MAAFRPQLTPPPMTKMCPRSVGPKRLDREGRNLPLPPASMSTMSYT
jgi:hypothetical protein